MYYYVYIGFMLTSAVLGLFNFSYLATYDINKQKLKFKSKNKIADKLTNDPKEIKEIESIFDKYGVSASPRQYQVVRYLVIGMFAALWISNMVLYGKNTLWGAFAIFTNILTIPKENIGKVKTPFYYALNAYSRSYKKKRDLELYNIVSQIKNIYKTTQGSVGVDYILREILKFTRFTKTIFVKFISLWDLNKKDEALEYFVYTTDSTIRRDLANIIFKLDSLKEEEIMEQLDMYQNAVRQEKDTYRLKSQEAKSAAYYALSIFLIILILFNMLVTVIFTDLMNQFRFIL